MDLKPKKTVQKRYKQILYNDEGINSGEYKSCKYTQKKKKCVCIPKEEMETEGRRIVMRLQ